MAENNLVDQDSSELVIAKAKDFWGRYGKIISIASIVVIVLGGAYLGYKYFIVQPRETKASEAMFRAEAYFRKDSVAKALNGDGQSYGFLRVIKDYGSTDAGNMAQFYAGSCYIKMNENQKAIDHLKKFSTSSKVVQARAYKLMADAYADLGQNKQALEYYQKAAHHFPTDEPFSAKCLFLGAYLAQKTLNDTKTATELYTELAKKYPRTQEGATADTYLAQMGVYSIDN